jgi:epoxyqueuosine reductase
MAVFAKGERALLIPVHKLESLKEELGRFRAREDLNGFQRWILEGMYELDPPAGFPAASILLAAVPHPFYATLEFKRGGRSLRCLSLVMSDFAAAESELRAAAPEGARILAAGKLPLKRLAVMSGFARYGRNNICYIDGMGSNFSFMAFFTDMPCDEGEWGEARLATSCEGCTRCVSACPTGAILADRYLIDNERCLSYLNESGEPYPAWLDPRAHHCVYDCLRCQAACPMNAGEREKTVGPIRFDAAETELLLSGFWLESCPPSLAEKARYLGFHQWPAGIAKTLASMFESRAMRGRLI